MACGWSTSAAATTSGPRRKAAALDKLDLHFRKSTRPSAAVRQSLLDEDKKAAVKGRAK
jgi:hypothetical protein